MDRFPAFFTNETTLIEYLRKYGKGADTPDYELATAVWIKRIYDSATKKQHCIGFEMTEALPTSFDFQNPEHIRDALERRKQATPIDFLLIEGTPAKHASHGFAFQLKRFPYNQKDEADFIDKMVAFINTKSLVSPGEVALVVIPEPNGRLNFSPQQIIEISKRLVVSESSYKKIILLLGSSEKASLVEMYPDVLYLKPLEH